MFRKASQLTYRQLMDGVALGTLVHGEKTLMARFQLKAGALLPVHHHPYEQTGFLLSGQIVIVIDGVEHRASAGDSWCIPADGVHTARAVTDAQVLEIFSPARPDYLE